jgi:CubicO group peptidase (beta-lactamase class C family)
LPHCTIWDACENAATQAGEEAHARSRDVSGSRRAAVARRGAAAVLAGAALAAVALVRADQGQPAQVPVPVGTPTELGLAGYTKILCSAVFVSQRDPGEAAKHSAYWMMPRGEADQVSYEVDRTAKLVRAKYADIEREARFFGDQGCVLTGKGIHFTPVPVKTTLPDAMRQPWPMGDQPDRTPLPQEVDREKLDAAVEAAFADPSALTAGFLVVYKGHIIAERYMPGITKDTQLESWSMGKSIIATLFSLLVKDGTYTIDEPAPVAAWSAPGDPRGQIRIVDLLHMSGGLRFVGNQEPGGARTQEYPDHYYIYTGAVDAYEYSYTRPPEFPPNTEGRYRNCDPLTIGYLVKQAVTKRGDEYLTWPQRVLFDRIGIRRQVLETDPYGNFLLTGYDYGTPRNWARLGLLYLQDGMWQGQRILPDGWSTFVSTLAPAWPRPVYGGLFWINGDGGWNLPRETYFMAGAGGQNTFIVPSRQLVIVRMGHFLGSNPARRATNNALRLLLEAITP